MAIVALWKFFRKYVKILEKLTIPMAAPQRNVANILKSKLSIAPKMYAYFPIIKRMNAPDIPGKIIAQIATIPQRKTNQSSSGVAAGLSSVMRYATIIPTDKAIIDVTFHCVIFFATSHAEAMMSPKKKAQVRML